jgi:hypothetical protein
MFEVCQIFFVVPFRYSPNVGPLIWIFFFVVDDVSDVTIEILLGADIVYILDDFIGFDVKFGHVDGQLLFFA